MEYIYGLLDLHPSLQILGLVLMLIGGIIIYRFRRLVSVIAVGAIAIFLSFKRKGK